MTHERREIFLIFTIFLFVQRLSPHGIAKRQYQHVNVHQNNMLKWHILVHRPTTDKYRVRDNTQLACVEELNVLNY